MVRSFGASEERHHQPVFTSAADCTRLPGDQIHVPSSSFAPAVPVRQLGLYRLLGAVTSYEASVSAALTPRD